MGDIRAESRGGMDDVYRENMDLRVSNRRRKRDDGEIQIARDGRCPMFLTIIDNKVTVKVGRGTEIPPFAEKYLLSFVHFSHFVGAWRTK